MTKITSRERYRQMYEHREANRVLIPDDPWKEDYERIDPCFY